MHFDSLPIEIKFKIFSYISNRELYSSVPLVSKEWHEIARDPFFRTWIELDTPDPAEKIQLLCKYNRVQALLCPDITIWDWITNMPQMTRVRDLEFSECRFEVSSIISKLVDCVPFVSMIVISCCEFDEIDCTSPLEGCQFLKSIYFEHKFGQTCPSIFLENCKNLEEIELICPCTTDLLFEKISNEHGANLKTLSFWGDGLSDFSYLQLNNFHRLTKLNICGADGLTNEGLLSIKKLNQLEDLSLEETNADFIHLFHETSFPHMTILNFSCCQNLQNKSIKLIAESCPTLSALWFSSCDDNNLDDGLSAVVEKCSCLKVIYLISLNTTTGKFLQVIPEHLPNLKTLQCRYCQLISKGELSRLKVKRPDILIYDSKGREIQLSRFSFMSQSLYDKYDALKKKVQLTVQ